MKKVVVYCASSSQVDEMYLSAAEKLGKLLAGNDFGVVYGGGKVGLMGRLAKGAIDAGGHVTGVIPDFMMDLELGNENVSELKIVKNMHRRQEIMMKESDYAIALPGGSGTMLEFMEIISWKRLGLVISPVLLINMNNYYTNLLKMIDRSIDESFMKEEYYGLWQEVKSVEEAVESLRNIRPANEHYYNTESLPMSEYLNKNFSNNSRIVK